MQHLSLTARVAALMFAGDGQRVKLQNSSGTPLLRAITSPAGEITSLSMYDDGSLLAWVNPSGDRTSYSYLTAGGAGQMT